MSFFNIHLSMTPQISVKNPFLLYADYIIKMSITKTIHGGFMASVASIPRSHLPFISYLKEGNLLAD